MNLEKYVSAWIDGRAVNLAASTVAGYRRLVRLYIAGTAAGSRDLSEVDGSDMIDLLSPLILRGCTRQAQLLQTLVSAALRRAVKRQLIPCNPMDEVERVAHHSRVTPWLTPEDARQLLASAEAAQDPFFIAWALMISCGLRRGEILALRWSDVDLVGGWLHVQRQLVVVDRQTLVTRPKSLSSIRDICLSPDLITLLRLHQTPGPGIVGEGISPGVLADALDRAIARAGVPRVTLHGLRHTMAAAAAGAGVPVKVLQSIMGHAHYQTTADIYEHVNVKPRQQAAQTITAALLPTRLEIA